MERCNVLFQWRLRSNSYILRKINRGNKNGVLRVLCHRDHCANPPLHRVAEAQQSGMADPGACGIGFPRRHFPALTAV